MACRLCLSSVSDDFDPKSSYADNLRILISKTFPQLRMDLCVETAVCEGCLGALLRCNSFKQDCVQSENKVALYRSLNGFSGRAVDLCNVLRFHGELEQIEEMVNEEEEDQVCRLCLKRTTQEGSVHLEPVSVHGETLARCLPEVDLTAAPKPMMCLSCVGSLAHMDSFLRTSTGVQRLIERYVQCNGLTGKLGLKELVRVSLLGDVKVEHTNDISVDNAVLKPEPDDVTWEIAGACEIKAEPIELKVFPSGDSEEANVEKPVGKKRGPKPKRKTAPPGSEFECEKCGKQFKRRSSFMYHSQHSHDGNFEVDLFRCELCTFSTAVEAKLQRHLLNKHEVGEPIHKCKLCSYSTSRKQYLSDHMKYVHYVTKTGKVLELLSCPECPYVTAKRGNLNRHVVCRHRDSGGGNVDEAKKQEFIAKYYTLLKCPHCSCQTYHRSYLNKHIRHKHGGPASTGETYRCDGCDYEARDKSYLQRHVLKTHQKLPRLSCSSCPFRTASSLSLRYHERRNHSSGPVHACHLCEFAGASPWPLTIHLQRKHPHGAAASRYRQGEYRCAQCDFCTVRKGSLVTHIKLLHPRRGDMRLYACDLCPFTTYRKSYHTRHRLLCTA